MPTSPPSWSFRAHRVLLILTGLTLVVQYIAGLWTNAYAPDAGFTATTLSSFPALQLHYGLGYLLGVLTLLLVIVSAVSRRTPFLVLSIVMLVAVGLAGVWGEMFVHSTPNDPIDSVLMGVAFLIAFWAGLFQAFLMMMQGGRRMPWMAEPTSAA